MNLDDLFQDLGLSLPFLVGSRHSQYPKIWNPQSLLPAPALKPSLSPTGLD